MAKTAQELLDNLANGGLVPPEALESLRRQVAKATKPVAPGTIARLLVDHGHLTEAQGERLVGAPLPASKKSSSHSGVLGLEPIGEKPKPPQPAPKPAVKSPSKSQAEIDLAAADLGLAPIHEAPKSAVKTNPAPAPAPKPAGPSKAAPSTITKAKPAPSGTPSSIAKAKAAPAPAAAPLFEELAPLSPLPGDDLFGPAAMADPFAASPVIPLDSPANLVEPLSAAGPLVAAPLAAQKPAAAKPAAAPGKRSKVLPIIAVVVVVLLIVGGIAGFVLTRSNGDEEFALAEHDYQAKSYDAAIAKHSTFLEDFPSSPKVGTARLHRGMAKILAASPSKDNYTTVLPVAKAALTEIGGEKELSQLHAELAPLLTDMAAALTEQAKQGKTAAESAEKLAQAKDALALANDGRFIPGSLRQWQRLAEVEESLGLLERDLGRGKSLEVALAEIKKHAEASKLDAALAERTKLLLAYPELAGDAALRDLGKQIGKTVAAGVKTAADSSKGESAEAKSSVLASLSLASGKPTTAAETPERTFFALAAGSVWAIDGGSGKLLWSRPALGNSGNGVTPLATDASSDVILADLFRNEVVCVNRRSGAVRWRHPFKESLTGEPFVLDGQVIVATTSGKIVALDAQSGNGKSAAQLPQGCRLGPVGGSGKTFVVAEHSFLYVLSPDLKCEAAVYLGHESGSIETPPTIVAGHAILAANRSSSSLLHVVALDEKGLTAGPSQQVDVAGLVTTRPVLLGERLLVLTDRQTVAFDYQPADDEPLKKLGETEAGTDSLTRFGAVHADKLWVAADGLRRFDFIPAGGTLKEAWAGFAGQAMEAPPQGIADTLFCVRSGVGRSGVIATALKAASGETLWETRLAQPLASLHIAADGASAVATTSAGADVKIELTSLSGASVLFLPVAPEATPTKPALDSPLAAPRISWAGGRLSISTSGSVELLDEKASAPLAEPFQLSIRPGSQLENCSAAPAGGDGANVVICDGVNSVYLLRLESAPQPRLILVAKATLKLPVISRIAALESSACVLDQSGALQVLSLPDLKLKPGAKIDCRAVVMGPEAVGKNFVLETDKGELVCLDAAGKQLWKIPLAEGPVAGRPLVAGGDFLLPTKRGVLLRLVAASGKELARADVGQPLTGSPALAGNAVLVPTAAGGILKVAIPEKK
ncbi:MAG: PQQ-binding-like beta-propeller repeat protein [Pirellulaceae bacterium]